MPKTIKIAATYQNNALTCSQLLTKLQGVLKQSKKKSNDQELIQSDPISCPQNQKGNN